MESKQQESSLKQNTDTGSENVERSTHQKKYQDFYQSKSNSSAQQRLLSSDGPENNLTNLASLDRENFFSQQQQIRDAAAFAAKQLDSHHNKPTTSIKKEGGSLQSEFGDGSASTSSIDLSSLMLDAKQEATDLAIASSDTDTRFKIFDLESKKFQDCDSQSTSTTSLLNGHFFAKKTFHKPTYCHHCGDMLWGLIGQGYFCDVCNFVGHERCIRQEGLSSCSTVAAQYIKNPTPHCWINELHPKRKFCNVCRKKIEDNTKSIRCTLCEYYVHLECFEFSLCNCRECATYVPNQKLADVNLLHHWREGNLPQSSSSKCAKCKVRCYSCDCLSGYRCEWCQVMSHASCTGNISRECNLGSLKSIILPPYCVSVPRTDLPMETILGISKPLKLDGNTSNIQSNQMPSNLFEPSGAITISASSLPYNSNLNDRAQQSFSSSFTSQNISHPNITKKHDHLTSRSTTSSSLSEQLEDNETVENQPEPDMVSRDLYQSIRVFDGNSSVKRLTFRWININRGASYNQLVSACLAAFHQHDENLSQYAIIDISNFISNALQKITTTSSSSINSGSLSISLLKECEEEVPNDFPIFSIIRNQNKKTYPSILLRFKPREDRLGTIKVFLGKLNLNLGDEISSVDVQVSDDTAVHGVITQALSKSDWPVTDDILQKYKLVEVSLDKASAIHQRTMDSQECPWEIIKNIARDSIRQKGNMRFYIHKRDTIHNPSVAIFVSNMPPNLKQTQYESILSDRLPKPYRFKYMNPIYYEHGSCVIHYDQTDIAVKAFNMLKESMYKSTEEEFKVSVHLLPKIMPDMIPDGVRPLLVFVNVRSGGCQGLDLITSFRRMLNPFQVYDLENGGPLPGLYVFRQVPDYRILVLGGDGSVGWVLQCLDNVGQDSICQSPPCAIIPLGTGNDLARVLRWGTGYTPNHDPMSFLRDIIDAEEVILDRWTVVLPSEREDFRNQDGTSLLSLGSAPEENNIIVMNNYFGIGIDAELCLEFHNAREENPNKFNSRLHNKGVYVKQALRKMINKRQTGYFNRDVALEVDGNNIPMPALEGLIILNISSWASGTNPWGPEIEDRFTTPSHDDGVLEVVGVSGIVHMGQIQSGMSRAMRIAQGSRIKIRLKTLMPVQVDGEPLVQPPGEINIIRSALKATMLRRIKIRRRNTEPSINQETSVSRISQDDWND